MAKKKELSDAKKILMVMVDDMPEEVASAMVAGSKISDEEFIRIADEAVAEKKQQINALDHINEDEKPDLPKLDQQNYIDMANKRVYEAMKFEKANLPKPMYNFGVQMRNNNTAIARAIADITAEAVYNSSLIALDYVAEAMGINNVVLVDMCKIVDEDE
jgi:hypothetical protein